MSNIVDNVTRVVRPGETFLVALSGGADSVSLLAILCELGHQCRAVHCNYHLRGEESNRDEAHARAVAQCLGVAIDVIQCDVEQFRHDNSGQSVEMACRELRYKAFNTLRSKYNLDSIAIGHHLEDNVETMLLNLVRGTGIKGLAAMTPRRGIYVRPLLHCSKVDILQYLEERNIDYVTDSSNLTNDYQRNILRNELMPLLTRYIPDAVKGMSRTLNALSGQRALLNEAVGQQYNRLVDADGTIDLAQLINSTSHPRALLFEILNYPDYRGFNIDIVDNIISRADSSGLTFRAASTGEGYMLNYHKLIPLAMLQSPLNDDDAEIEIDLDNLDSVAHILGWEIISPQQFSPQRDSQVAYFDLERLRQYHGLVLRHPRHGDRIQPWGMKGSRLLSDIFTDLHYDMLQRKKIWVLTADDCILWIVGIRASRHACVTKSTTRILRLSTAPAK